MTVSYAPYVVGNVVLSDHTQALADATAPAATAPTQTPQSTLSQADLTKAQQDALQTIENIPGIGGLFGALATLEFGGLGNGSSVASQASSGLVTNGGQTIDANPLDILGNAAGAAGGVAAAAVAQGIGEAALAGLTALGHLIASGIVSLLQWSGTLAKQHVVPLAVAAVVLYMVFFR